jgi:hypothetical protein
MYGMCSRIALLGLAMLPLANAQSTQALRAHVPFSFAVNKTLLPAGDYDLRYEADHQFLAIWGSGPNAASHAFARTRPIDGNESGEEGPARLLFRCYGQACFLSQIWQGTAVASRGLEVPETRSERELAANRNGKIVAAIAISRK